MSALFSKSERAVIEGTSPMGLLEWAKLNFAQAEKCKGVGKTEGSIRHEKRAEHLMTMAEEKYAAPFTMLPERIELSDGLVATLGLDPMPQAGPDGKFPRFVGQDQPQVMVAFERDGKVLSRCNLFGAIGSEDPIALDDGTEVGFDNMDDLDSKGWDVLFRYGLFPTAFCPH
jgi:hypothetical protein